MSKLTETIRVFLWLKLKEITRALLRVVCAGTVVAGVLVATFVIIAYPVFGVNPWLLTLRYMAGTSVNWVAIIIIMLFAVALVCGFCVTLYRWLASNWREAKRIVAVRSRT